MLYRNAVIWTGDAGLPWAEAMLVEDSRIRAVGSVSGLRKVAGGVREIDLGGGFLCPGLVDAHAHVLGFGIGLERIDLVGTRSLEETLERIAEYVASRKEEGFSGWIRGRGWDQNDWPVTGFPTRQDLDRVSGTFPVVLSRIGGHAMWVNTRALALAGIGRDTPDPPGGKIHRDAAGEPTGILVDTAKNLMTAVMPETDRETKVRAIRRATEVMARAGLTGAHDMGMSVEELGIYRELADRGELAARIYASISATDDGLAEVLAAGPDDAWRGGTFKLGMVKFYVDGALGSRGAALIGEYADDPGNRGLLIVEPDALEQGMREALDAGFQCAVHAIGDRANRVVLDAWERIRRDGGDGGWGRGGVRGGGAGLRPVPEAPPSLIGKRDAVLPAVRIEHAQIVHPADLARFGTLGVIASMQPTHCTSDMPWAPRRLGESRLTGAYAWRRLIAGGAVLASGSDFPVESHDPLLGLLAAVTRRQPDGIPAAGWSPDQRLGREEALATFTAAPAYASGDLHQLGTLAPGKLADFVVYDRNLVTCDPEDLPAATVQLTVLGGRPVWIEPTAGFAGALGE